MRRIGMTRIGTKAAAAFAAVAFFTGAFAAEDEGARFARFLSEVYEARTAESPMLAAEFGLDTGRDRWDNLSPAAHAQRIERIRAELARAEQDFDPAAMDARRRLQHRVFVAEQKLLLERERWRDHLYPMNQIVGLHLDVPGVLVNQHPVRNAADAEAYLSRINRTDRLFAQFIEDLERRATAGFYMPKSVYPLLIHGAERVISGAPFDEGEDNPIWADFRRKLAAVDMPAGDKAKLEAKVRVALLGPFRTAYSDLIAVLRRQAEETKIDGGVWQLPEGDAFYAFLVRQFTTTDMTPDEIHELGLREADRIRGEMEGIMRRVGFQGTLRDFMAWLKADPRFYFENSDAGREAYMKKARDTVAAMAARITEVFHRKPAIPLEVRRFEPYREKTSPSGYYEAGAPDGSRPGAIYLGLADMSKAAIYDLDALLYHEGLPGHHMQISTILSDPGIPQLRKISFWWLNSAFVEGWALYAERLAKDMGFYEDPYADFGRLAGELWRAYRLVVDSGLHHKRWTREQAIQFLNDNTTSPAAANEAAVDRYLAVPGQATSFMVGMKRFLDLRAKAQDALGDRFDIRDFHQVVLENGYIPLWAVEEAVDAWIAAEKAAN